jgi:hypothetical protein
MLFLHHAPRVGNAGQKSKKPRPPQEGKTTTPSKQIKRDKDKEKDQERDVRLSGATGEAGQDADLQDRVLGG